MGMPQMAASMARRSSVRFVSSTELNRPAKSCASALDPSATQAIASEMFDRFICLLRYARRDPLFSSGLSLHLPAASGQNWGAFVGAEPVRTGCRRLSNIEKTQGRPASRIDEKV